MNGAETRVVVMNPQSGNGQHPQRVEALADEYGFTVHRTEYEDHAVELAEEAVASGATFVAAAGGDGTLNEVVEGLDRVDALDHVTFGVIPCGTGNNFAQNIGIDNIEHAFQVFEHGDRRTIDLGTANGALFLNSCVGGLTANASKETTSDLKNRLGVLAYVITTLQTAREFDGLQLRVSAEAPTGDDTQWEGEAIVVLVGNCRRFPEQGRTQANVEDGLFDVTIIERVPAADLLGDAAARRLFGRESEHITHLKTPSLQLTAVQDEPVDFSFDGEITSHQTLTLDVRPDALTLPVGDAYEVNPES